MESTPRSPLTWRRGLWRLTFSLWGLGVVGLVALLLATSSPSSLVHPDGTLEPPRTIDGPSYEPKQFREEGRARPPQGHESEESTYSKLFREYESQRYTAIITEDLPAPSPNNPDWYAWEEARVPRWQKSAYWSERARESAPLFLGWSALLWGTFYLAAWIASGFRGPPPGG